MLSDGGALIEIDGMEEAASISLRADQVDVLVNWPQTKNQLASDQERVSALAVRAASLSWNQAPTGTLTAEGVRATESQLPLVLCQSRTGAGVFLGMRTPAPLPGRPRPRSAPCPPAPRPHRMGPTGCRDDYIDLMTGCTRLWPTCCSANVGGLGPALGGTVVGTPLDLPRWLL